MVRGDTVRWLETRLSGLAGTLCYQQEHLATSRGEKQNHLSKDDLFFVVVFLFVFLLLKLGLVSENLNYIHTVFRTQYKEL